MRAGGGSGGGRGHGKGKGNLITAIFKLADSVKQEQLPVDLREATIAEKKSKAEQFSAAATAVHKRPTSRPRKSSISKRKKSTHK